MWYYGQSSNPNTRLEFHNSGGSAFTKSRGPWELIFKRGFDSKRESLKFEKYLKKLKNKEFIRKEFIQYFIN